jgi:hypothetical protein
MVIRKKMQFGICRIFSEVSGSSIKEYMEAQSKQMLSIVLHYCIILNNFEIVNRLCSLVVRASGCRSRGSGFDSQRYQIFREVVGLERGPLSLVSITEELLEWKSSGSRSRKPRLTTMRIRCADHATPPIRKCWH